MSQEILNDLAEQARKRFGDSRAAELDEDIHKLAKELAAVRQYPISIDDEP